MKWANAEQVISIQVVDEGVAIDGFETLSTPLPSWLLDMPDQAPHVFSDSEMDAIAVNAASREAGEEQRDKVYECSELVIRCTYTSHFDTRAGAVTHSPTNLSS